VISVGVTIRGGPEIAARAFVDCVNAGLEKAVLMWHQRFAPTHFEHSARWKYGYALRTPKYRKAKLRKLGHEIPLIWSGTFQRQVLRAIEIRRLRTRAEVSGKMRASVLNLVGRRSSKMPDLKKEMLATTNNERLALAFLADAEATKALNGLRETQTKKLA
jgi:hypothetical protein